MLIHGILGRKLERKIKLRQENINLELLIQYTLEEEGVTVLSCKGYGTAVVLPDFINGYPVRKIGAYAFSDPEKGLALLPEGTEVFTGEISGIRVPGGRKESIYGKRLQEITLPGNLEIIDEYAFYNCRNLNAAGLFSGRLRIENGAFMNCEKLKNIFVNGSPEKAPGVRGVLMELSSELCITFSDGSEKGIFLFPEYYEDSEENTPARVFQYLLYGAGYRYRQCFKEGILEIHAYDEVFQSAEIQTIYETALRIAFFRLRYPYRLHKNMKQQYLDYVTLYLEEAVKLVLSQDNIEEMVFLAGLGIMTEKNFTVAQEEAVRLGRKECAGILLEERLRYYPPAEKEYEL